jgi:hypothetical protein
MLTGPDAAAAEHERVAEACRQVLRKHLPALDAELRMRNWGDGGDGPPRPPAMLGLTEPRRVIAGERALPLCTLTPRDLESSPTLTRIGRLARSAGDVPERAGRGI